MSHAPTAHRTVQALLAAACVWAAPSLMAQSNAQAGAKGSAQSATRSTPSAPQKSTTPTAAERARQTARRATAGAGAAAAATAAALALADEDQRHAYSLTHIGAYDCEFKRTISVQPHPRHEGYVNLHFDRQVVTAKPVLSSTGAIRLEDIRGQFMMLQIAHKSMLMDVRKGQRVADECLHDRHVEARREALLAPPQPGLGIAPGSPTETTPR